MLEDELPHRLVVLAEDAHHLFRLRRLGEAGEAAEVQEHHGDLAAVGAERVVGAAGHDQLGQLGREEALQPAQALHLRHLLRDALLEGPVPLGELEGVPRFLIPQALLLEAGADPGPEQHDVAGLGQVVLRAELDRADDAGDLVERRDHQDRDVPPVRILLEALQHGRAVEVGHHDVEKHQVHRLVPAGERAPPGRLSRPGCGGLPGRAAGSGARGSPRRRRPRGSWPARPPGSGCGLRSRPGPSPPGEPRRPARPRQQERDGLPSPRPARRSRATAPAMRSASAETARSSLPAASRRSRPTA